MRDFRYQPADERNVQFAVELILLGVGLGFLVGAIYLPYCLWFESAILPALRIPGKPLLSYGQQCGVAWVQLVILGAAAGVAMAAARRFNLLIAAVWAAMAAHLIGGSALAWWNASLRRHGPDPSDWIVYAPPFATAGIVLAGAVIAAAIGLMRMMRRDASRRIGPF